MNCLKLQNIELYWTPNILIWAVFYAIFHGNFVLNRLFLNLLWRYYIQQHAPECNLGVRCKSVGCNRTLLHLV